MKNLNHPLRSDGGPNSLPAGSRRRRVRPGLAIATSVALALAGAALPATSAAAAGTIIADFSFDDSTVGLTGGSATAAVRGTFTQGDGADGTKAARISKGFWLDVTKTDGTPLLAGLDDVTFSYDSNPNSASSNTGWAFIAERSTAPQTYQQEHYLGVMDKASTVTVERYNNSGTRDSTGNLAASPTPSGWKHVDVVISGTSGKLFVDGALRASNTQGKLLTDILTSSGGVLQLGKADWVGGEYFSGLLDNFMIYNGALTDAEIQSNAVQGAAQQIPASITIEDTSYRLPGAQGLVTWSSQMSAITIAADGTTAQVTRPAAGSPAANGTLTATISRGSSTVTKQVNVTVTAPPSDDEKARRALAAIAVPQLYDVRSSLSLPTSGEYGLPITWTSSDPSVITDSATAGAVSPGVVTRGGEDRSLTLTATVGGLSREFTAVVRAKVAIPETTDYLFAYFTGTEQKVTDEQIYFATSNDGDNWTDTRPDAQPVLSSVIGDRGVRDPYLVRSPEGDTFYLIATDLSIYYRGGWGNAQATTTGSMDLVVWKSNDLVHWSAPQLTDVASGIPGAGMAWAPEAFWDATKKQYVVYWATTSPATNELADPANPDPTNIYYATTRDFVTFSTPVKWIDRTRSIIDTTMIKVGDWYYRASGDGQITIERSKDLYAITTSPTAPAYVDDYHWSLVGTLATIFNNSAYSGAQLEGPEFFEYNEDDRQQPTVPLWGLMADQYARGAGYLPFRTTNIADATTNSWTAATDVNFGELKKRHGTILSVTAEELAAITAATVGTTGTLVDSTAPTLESVSLNGSPANWYSSPSLSWKASDDSEAEPALETKAGEGEWRGYSGSVAGLAQGSNTVLVRAVDAAGNHSATREVTVKFDSVAPSSTVTADTTARTVKISSTDASSGLAAVEYSIDGASWIAYSTPITVGNGATTVWYRARDAAGNIESAKTVSIDAVPAPGDAPFTTTPNPTVSGTARVGSKLTASAGTWQPAPVTLTYQWLRSGRPVAGATGATYTPGAADRGAALTVQVTGTKPGYTSVTVTSAPTAKVAKGKLSSARPHLKGTEKVGKKLRAVAGSWGPAPVKLSYTWFRSGERIRGATNVKYTLIGADRGEKIAVKVTGKKAGYTTVSSVSRATSKVRRAG
jgi:hypothetical protein